MKRFVPTFIVVALIVGIAAGPAFADTIGHYNSTVEDYGLSTGYISDAATALGTYGHTLSSTSSMTSTFLASVDRVYIGLLGSSVTATEIANLQSFVSGGGMLFIQQDHSGGGWHSIANNILDDFGASSTGNSSVNSHTITSATSQLTTYPNDIRGAQITGQVEAHYDSYTSDWSVLSTMTGAKATGLYRNYGNGWIITTSDINMWNSSGWADSDNKDLWENIWSVQAVPLPAAAWLGLAMLGSLGIVRRIRRRRSK
jgi:hypothetical protein